MEVKTRNHKFCFLELKIPETTPQKNLHTTPNSRRLIHNLAIDETLKYASLALDCELSV